MNPGRKKGSEEKRREKSEADHFTAFLASPSSITGRHRGGSGGGHGFSVPDRIFAPARRRKPRNRSCVHRGDVRFFADGFPSITASLTKQRINYDLRW